MSAIDKILQIKGVGKYFQNTSWLFLERVLRLGIAFVIGIYIARYLSPEKFGMLNYAMSFVGIFTSLAALGLDSIMVRDMVKYPDRELRLLGTAFYLKLIAALVMIGVIVVAAQLSIDDAFTRLLIYVIASAEIFKAFGVVDFFFQAKVQSKQVVKIQLVQIVVSSVIKLLMIYYQAPLIYFAATSVIESAIMGIGFWITYGRSGGSILKWRYDGKLAANLLKESWPLMLYGLALYIQTRIDQVMIGNMLGNVEVAQYSVALRMIEAIGFIPLVIQSTFMPAITRAKSTSVELYRSRRLNLYRLMFILFLVTGIPLFIVAEPIIVMLFGAEYQPAGVLLALFSIRLFFYNMGVAKSTFITNESLFKYTLVTVVLGAAVNIFINYLMIPVYGAKGAIIATIISFIVSIFLIDVYLPKTRENLFLMFRGIASFWKIRNIS